MTVIIILVGLVALKIVLMRAVWRMAGEQGKSQWLCLIASLFAALIVFLALYVNGRERKLAQPDLEPK
jgi:hypothetical protein